MVDLATFIEVQSKQQDDFLKVKETLTRIGVSSRKEKNPLSILSYSSQERAILYCSL